MEETLARSSLGMSEKTVVEAMPIRYCLYARKSTEQDELQALSIDSQIKEMSEIAQRERLDVVDVRSEKHSAKAAGQRPVYQQLLTDVRDGKFNGILTWAPDRLSLVANNKRYRNLSGR
jgi:DNA invertase Pin-like site-specific DNA recombinase